MTRTCRFAFGPFVIDVVDERLWRHGAIVPLGHKAFTVLAHLVGEPNQLATKDQLLSSVWPDTAVGDAVLTTAMREIRRALGDTTRMPQFVETVHGRGYRFIAPVREASEDPRVRGASAAPLGRPTDTERAHDHDLVGRETEWAQLSEWYAAVEQGTRRIGFLSGEAGIGKTTLVDAFVDALVARAAVRIARGQCIEQFGAGEPYLPVLEALGRLRRDPEASLGQILRDHAPSWLAHLPGMATGSEPSAPVRPERMLREFAEALEVLASREPLIFILEDLQWSDSATLESLAYVARRRDPARLLVLATYRPVEAVLHNTRLRHVLAEVRNQPQVAEIVLDYLPREAVHAFLRQRCGTTPGLEALVDVLHHRTGGHPLFLASVVDELLRSVPRERDLSGGDVSAMALTIPLNVHRFIEHHLERLSDEDQSILEAASVAGHPFRVATVAAFTSLAEEHVERRCAALARTHGMLVPDGFAAGPAGTVGPRYRFRHALFQETVYARISPERRARLHLLAGERLEAAYSAQPADTGAGSTIAAELAAHFEQGRDLTKAVKYLELAGRNALQRSAYGEAHDHVGRALKLVPHLAERAERSRVEAALSLLLAQVLESTQGWGAQDVAGMYSRARELSAAVHDEPRVLQATWGLIAVTVVRADLVKTQALAREMLALARTRRNALFRMAAHAELGGTALALGRTPSARRHFRLAEALHDPNGHRSSVAAFGVDLGIFARIWATHAMWYEGYPDRAVALAEGAMTMAAGKGHVFTLTITRAYAAMLSQFRRDVAAVDRLATLALAQATQHGFAYYRAWAEVLLGWSAGVRGKGRESLETLHRGVEQLQATAGLRLAYYRALIAETCGRIGRFDEGLQVLSSAFDDVRTSGECWWEPELHRIRGELLAGTGPSNDRDAEGCYRMAIELAQRQHAPLLELRAAVSLTRLCQRHGRARETSSMLIRLTDRLTEGFGDSDVSEARLLIESATKTRKNAPHARRRLPSP